METTDPGIGCTALYHTFKTGSVFTARFTQTTVLPQI